MSDGPRQGLAPVNEPMATGNRDAVVAMDGRMSDDVAAGSAAEEAAAEKAVVVMLLLLSLLPVVALRTLRWLDGLAGS